MTSLNHIGDETLEPLLTSTTDEENLKHVTREIQESEENLRRLSVPAMQLQLATLHPDVNLNQMRSFLEEKISMLREISLGIKPV